ncbi:WbqC family protein [Streptomyces sp. NPDC058471]|uniref:WbqC family protein n=1 Tax=Streptomyces sp. NPDC058471 TaxID=3346516 RepID=UPI00364A17DA
MALPSDVLVAHQPAYLPWSGFFSRLLDRAEILVLLDHVQYSERGWQNRNLVRNTSSGDPVRLTVPVRHRFGQRLREVEIASEEPWARRHWRTLQQTYARAPFWSAYAAGLEQIYQQPWNHLTALNEALIRFLLDALGLPIRLVHSSDLAPSGRRTAMLVDLCQLTGARVLRVGTGAGEYLDLALLDEHDITVETASFTHPRYGHGPSWAPGLSVVDLLMHEGPQAPAFLRAGARTDTKVATS